MTEQQFTALSTLIRTLVDYARQVAEVSQPVQYALLARIAAAEAELKRLVVGGGDE